MTEKNNPKDKLNKPSTLEKIYRQYLTPMTLEEWEQTHDLSQPTTLKQVPTRTSSSSE